MKNSHQIAYILIVCGLFVAIGLFTFFNGVKPHSNHYIKIEAIPKIEFLTDINNNVESFMPLNIEAKELVVLEEFIGLTIEDATEKFIDLCAQANYINVDGKDNAVRITVVSGFMQALELKVYETINKYFISNEIYGLIIENDNDLQEIKEAKSYNIASTNKLSLIKSICLQKNNCDIKSLSNKTEAELLDILKEIHTSSDYSSLTYSQNEIVNKSKLIDLNRTNIENHRNSISNASMREFQKNYDEFRRLNLASYEQDFDAKVK